MEVFEDYFAYLANQKSKVNAEKPSKKAKGSKEKTTKSGSSKGKKLLTDTAYYRRLKTVICTDNAKLTDMLILQLTTLRDLSNIIHETDKSISIFDVVANIIYTNIFKRVTSMSLKYESEIVIHPQVAKLKFVKKEVDIAKPDAHLSTSECGNYLLLIGDVENYVEYAEVTQSLY